MSFQPPQTTVQGYPARTGLGEVYVNKTIQAGQLLYAWKKEHVDQPDFWLRELIVREFNKMLIANINGRPSADVIAMTADIWVDVVGAGMTEDDRERVQKGFMALWQKMKKWPQPAELLEVLPRRISPGAHSGITAKATASEEDHARAAAEFARFMEGLK